MARRAAATAYDDEELSAEEQAAIETADKSTELPPPDSEEGAPDAAADQQPPAEAPAAAEPAAADKPAAEQQPQPATQPAAQPVDEEADFAAFLERNKGKSPEELARIAFQQSKRASREAASGRVANQQLRGLAERAKAALERREAMATQAPEAKEKFRKRLAEDPDNATAELFDRLVDREVLEADALADQARFEEAVAFGSAHLPGFDQAWPEMRSLATEIGYSPEEINGITDGRDIVTLGLARYAANAIKAGFMDAAGNLVAMPPAVAEATDPRLSAPDPVRTIGSGGARATDGTPSTEQALTNILNLSDADFEKLSEEDLNNILRAAG